MSARDEAAGGVGPYGYLPPRDLGHRRRTTPAVTKNGKTLFYIHRARDPDGPSITSMAMSPRERDALAKKIVAFLNADASPPSPRDQAYSAMLGALEEKGALLSAEQVMAEVYAAAHPAVAKVLRDAFEGRGFSPKTETGCVPGVALRDLALEPVTMYRRRVAKAEAPYQLRRSAGIEPGEGG